MAERDLIERLNDAIDAVVARQAAPRFEPELAMLLAVAADLRDLPDPRFKTALKAELFGKEEETMQSVTTVQTLRPYLIVRDAEALIDFIGRTFGGELLQRFPTPEGKVMHAEVRIADSIVELADANEKWKAMAPPLHVYVDDVDATYRRAVDAGATPLFAPVDQPYGLREGGFRDPVGGEWFVAQPRPAAFATAVNPAIRVSGAATLIAFLEAAFGAEVVSRDTSPSGQIVYSHLRVGESSLELSDAHGQWGPTTGLMRLFVEDPDEAYASAVRAGGRSVQPPADQTYGERSAIVGDAFGNLWNVAKKLSAPTKG